MKHCPPRFSLVLGLLLGAVAGASGAGSPRPVSYHRDIRPLLESQCQGCHQPAKAKGDYVLTSFAAAMVPGGSGERPVVPREPEASHLLRLITPENGKAEMPKGRPPLAATELDLVRRWIQEGAIDDSPVGLAQGFDAAHPPSYLRPAAVTSLDYSPDGTLLAVAGYHEVLLHQADGGGLAGRLIGLSERIQTVRFSPDGTLLAVAAGQPGRLGEIQIWDIASRQLRTSVPVGFDTTYGVNWSPDGRLVSFGCPDKTVRAIEAATGRQVLQQMAHEDWVLDTVFSTNGSHVISVGRDMTAKLTEIPTQRFVDNITSITPGALRGGLASVARHPHRDEVLVGGADGRPQIYQVFRQVPRKIGDNANLLRKFPDMDGRITGVDYSPDGSMIAAVASLDGHGFLNLYSARFDPTLPESLLQAYRKTSGEYSQAEKDAIEQFTTRDVAVLQNLPFPQAPLYSVAFSPDGHRVAVGTGSGLVLIHSVATGSLDLVFSAAPMESLGAPAMEVVASQPPEVGHTSDSGNPDSEPAAPSAVVDLAIEPSILRLATRTEQIQILVQARLESGETVDMTRRATFEVSGGLGTVSPSGLFSPLRAGVGMLRVSLAGRTREIPIDLGSFQPTFAADFVRDVSPVLARLGCNAGTCHGSKEGKNGFKLSLRGYDALFDVRALGDDVAARRINPAAPERSLMLLKGTGAVPHEGGARTPTGSGAYAILHRWIAEGARLDASSPKVTRIAISPSNPVIQRLGGLQQVRVVATYADGQTRDVTPLAFLETGNADVASVDQGGLVRALRRGEAPVLARYEGAYAATTMTVMGDRDGFTWEDPPANNRIDELVAAKWQRLRIRPSGLSDDATFLRRVSLDLTGLPPTEAEVREFLANPRDPRSKRDAVIERLLQSPAYADHWANKWADLLQVNRKFLGEEGARGLRDWIRAQVAANTPYDRFVEALLTATGSNRENPAAAYWKILRTPEEAMENTTHLFLAVRFNCNKCHDHPFERWTQDQYYELAQYFAQVVLTKDEASGDRRIGGTAVEGAKPLFEVVSDGTSGGVKHGRTGREVEPGFPYPARAPAAALAQAAATSSSRRSALAAWITSPDNRYFALSYVNRLWGYLLGVGLIEPLDDLRAGNPPSNPELLEHLTREFVESGFNVRHILRQICQSRTYQLALEPNRWNVDDRSNYSHAQPRRLPAEVLFDAVHRATGSIPNIPGAPAGTRASQLLDPGLDAPSGFLANLGRPQRESSCECERSNDLKLSSILSLLSGPAVSRAIADPANDLARLSDSEPDDVKLTESLFLRVLGRHAAESEQPLLARAIHEVGAEHDRLKAALREAETAWSANKTRLEQERALAMERAEKALAYHLVEQAPRFAAAVRAREERIAEAETEVRDHEGALDARTEQWETRLTQAHRRTVWLPLNPKSVQASGSATLTRLPDGSIRSTASVGELPTHTVTAETSVAAITGIKLEVLPDPHLPAFGPGHAEGSFALAELVVEAAPRTNAGAFSRVPLARGATDHIREGYHIEELFNGIAEQGRPEGWRLGKEVGRPHWAALALQAPVGDTNGTVLRFSLQFRLEAPHEIGRYRLWVTTSADATGEGLPAALVPALETPPERRSPDQAALLRDHVRSLEPDFLARDFAVTLAREPLPADGVRAQLEQDLSRASRPVAVDPLLLRLREDLRTSERQLARRRLTAVQDVAWALINTPAFLFNR